MRRHTPVRPRITLHNNGTATVSGVPYETIDSILTEAYLYRSEHPVVPTPKNNEYPIINEVIEANNKHALAWERTHLWIIKRLEQCMKDAIAATFPPQPEVPLKQRLRENEKERQIIRRMMERFRQSIRKEHTNA